MAAGPRSADGLRIGGLTALTTIDYPGELAAVVYCQGCPYRCPYCHNAHLIPSKCDAPIPWAELERFLVSRRGLLDAVVFSGGEPTLQPALGAAMVAVRSLGLKVGLHTAGPYPARIGDLLGLLDWVGLDIKALPADYPLVTGVPGSGQRAWESLQLLLHSGVALEVRTTPMPGMDGPDYLSALSDRLVRVGVDEHRIQTRRTVPEAAP